MREMMDFVKELSFVRVGGSAEEKKAAELIMGEISSIAEETGREDIRGEYMTFQVPDAKVAKCSVRTAEREIVCVPYLRSGNIDRECDLVYLYEGSEIDFAVAGNLEGKAVLLNRPADEELYKRLLEHKVSAFLVMQGKYYLSGEEASLYPRILREHLTKHGLVPGFMIPSSEALRLVQDETDKVYLTLEQEDTEPESQNILAVIEGTECKEESIVLTAHYDSVPVGTGSWDNATGAVALLSIFRHFAANPARRTLRFVWCGSEEIGLKGSEKYCEAHKDDLKKIIYNVNFDMLGNTLGQRYFACSACEEVLHAFQFFAKVKGIAFNSKLELASSDSTSFAKAGVPSSTIGKGAPRGGAEIHSYHDMIERLDPDTLYRDVNFSLEYVDMVVNAAVNPIPKELSKAVKEKIDQAAKRMAEIDGEEKKDEKKDEEKK